MSLGQWSSSASPLWPWLQDSVLVLKCHGPYTTPVKKKLVGPNEAWGLINSLVPTSQLG